MSELFSFLNLLRFWLSIFSYTFAICISIIFSIKKNLLKIEPLVIIISNDGKIFFFYIFIRSEIKFF